MKKILIASIIAAMLLIVICSAPFSSATILPDNPQGTTVGEIGMSDTMVNNYGTVTTNNGTIENNYGIVVTNNGTIENSPVLYVGGERITDTSSGTGWSYNAGTNTLTLTGGDSITTGYLGPCETSGYLYIKAIIYDGRDTGLNIVVEGNNTISSTAGDVQFGIYVKGNLNISGTGTLTVSTTAENGWGIFAKGTLTIPSGTITGRGESNGIGSGGNMTISGGTVNAVGFRDAAGSNGISTENGNLTITGGNVTARGYNYDAFVSTNGPLGAFSISSGELNLPGSGNLDVNGPGATFSGGTVNITSGQITIGGGSFTMTGGNIFFTGATTAEECVFSNAVFSIGEGITPVNLKYMKNNGDYVECPVNEATYLFAIANGNASIGTGIVSYTVSFDANGGSGTMADVTGISGEYTLPDSTFTAPDGKEFKCWKVGEDEKNAGDKITVNSDITVKAVWKDKEPSGGGSNNIGLIIGGIVAGIVVIGAVAFFVIKRH